MAEITVQDYYTEVKLGEKKIMLKSGAILSLRTNNAVTTMEDMHFRKRHQRTSED